MKLIKTWMMLGEITDYWFINRLILAHWLYSSRLVNAGKFQGGGGGGGGGVTYEFN